MWEPITDDPRVERAVGELAETLARGDAPAADLAVFWTYLSTIRSDDATAEHAARALERFAAALDRGFARPGFHDGLAGAGWVAAHVAHDVDALLAVVDARLVESVLDWRGGLDLVSGLAGVGVYFLERESAEAAHGRAVVVEHLARTAEHVEGGIAWRTPPALLAEADRASWPDGVYDCGVAHGVAGIAGVLARIAARPDAPPNTASLADGAERWLLAQLREGRMPAMLDATRRREGRVAWCYGAPGVMLALGGREDVAAWMTQDIDTETVSLCHGAAGLMHAAHRMYQATRRDEYRGVALAWLERVLAQLGEIEGAGLVDGRAGVALALLAMISDLEPAWDRALLCDLPVTRRRAR